MEQNYVTVTLCILISAFTEFNIEVVIRPHRKHSFKIRPTVTDVARFVCASVCVLVMTVSTVKIIGK